MKYVNLERSHTDVALECAFAERVHGKQVYLTNCHSSLSRHTVPNRNSVCKQIGTKRTQEVLVVGCICGFVFGLYQGATLVIAFLS